jgi:hypothetical protein
MTSPKVGSTQHRRMIQQLTQLDAAPATSPTGKRERALGVAKKAIAWASVKEGEGYSARAEQNARESRALSAAYEASSDPFEKAIYSQYALEMAKDLRLRVSDYPITNAQSPDLSAADQKVARTLASAVYSGKKLVHAYPSQKGPLTDWDRTGIDIGLASFAWALKQVPNRDDRNAIRELIVAEASARTRNPAQTAASLQTALD